MGVEVILYSIKGGGHLKYSIYTIPCLDQLLGLSGMEKVYSFSYHLGPELDEPCSLDHLLEHLVELKEPEVMHRYLIVFGFEHRGVHHDHFPDADRCFVRLRPHRDMLISLLANFAH